MFGKTAPNSSIGGEPDESVRPIETGISLRTLNT